MQNPRVEDMCSLFASFDVYALIIAILMFM